MDGAIPSWLLRRTERLPIVSAVSPVKRPASAHRIASAHETIAKDVRVDRDLAMTLSIGAQDEVKSSQATF